MPKRYKRKNKKKKKPRANDDFYKREQEINRLINDFVSRYFALEYPPVASEYPYMNEERLKIKRLFDLQDGEVWKQSKRRKMVYYKQLERFKYYYTAWKHFTYYIYLNLSYDLPIRFSTTLSFFKKHQHDINSIRFQL